MSALRGFPNARDLGGLGTAQDRRLPPRRLLRAGTPGTLSEAELREASSAGWERIVDLRSDAEVAACPHPLRDLPAYEHLPLIDPAAEAQRDPAINESVGRIYQTSLSRNAGHIASIFRALAAIDHGPVLVCCAGGRDRTGMICALWLDLADVAREVIVQDYTLSEPTGEGGPGREGRRDIEGMLEYVEAAWGSTRAYSSYLGLSSADIRRLTTYLTP